MRKLGWCWAILLAGCHSVFPHNPGEAGAGDGPRAERSTRDGGRDRDGSRQDRGGDLALDRGSDARIDARADAPQADASRDAHPPDAAPATDLGAAADITTPADLQPPPAVATGQPCGNGTTSLGCCTGKWCWQSPLPQGNDLHAAWAFAHDDIVYVGDHGTILHWYKGQFYKDTSNTKVQLLGVWGTLLPKRTLWAVGEGGTIITRSASSATWVSQPSTVATNIILRGIHGRSASEIYAVGNSNTVLKYDGSVWTKQTWVGVTGPLHAVFANTSKVYVGGLDGLWSKSTSVVPELPGVDVRGLWSNAPGDVVAVGGGVRRLSGVSWPTIDTGTHSAVWGDGQKYWVTGMNAAGQTGIFALSSGNVLNLAQPALEIWALGGSGTTAVAFGRRGAIWRYSGTWNLQTKHATQSSLNGIWGSAANDLWSVGGTEIFRNPGTGWSSFFTFPGACEYRAISGQLAYKVAVGRCAGGAAPSVNTHIDGTAVTLQNPVPPQQELKGVWVEATGKAYAASDFGLHRYTGVWDPVQTVQSMAGVWGFDSSDVYGVGGGLCTGSLTFWTCQVTSDLRAVWGRTATGNRVVAAVGAGVIVYRPPASTSWSTVTVAENLRGIWGHQNGTVYAVGEGGAIRASGNLASWGVEESGTNKQLNAIWAVPTPNATMPCVAWAVGDTGTILCKQP